MYIFFSHKIFNLKSRYKLWFNHFNQINHDKTTDHAWSSSIMLLLFCYCPLDVRCVSVAAGAPAARPAVRPRRGRPGRVQWASDRLPRGLQRQQALFAFQHTWCILVHCNANNATAMHFVQCLTPNVWTCGRVCYISHSMPEKLKKWTMRGSTGFFWHSWVSEGFPLKRSCLEVEVPPCRYMGWRISPDGLKNCILNDVGMRFQSCQAPLQISKDGGRQTSPWLRDPVSGQPRRVRHRISSASMLFTFLLLTASKDMLW